MPQRFEHILPMNSTCTSNKNISFFILQFVSKRLFHVGHYLRMIAVFFIILENNKDNEQFVSTDVMIVNGSSVEDQHGGISFKART